MTPHRRLVVGRVTPHRRLLLARAGYVVVVLLATLAHLGFSWDRAAAAGRLARALMVPLGWRDAVDGLRNVALFAGLGSVWVVTSRSGQARREILRATLVGFVLSATVEGLQCFSPIRTASLVDVGTNTSGALVGAALIAVLVATVRDRKGSPSYLGVPTLLLAATYYMVVLAEALTPLFRSVAPADLGGGPLQRIHVLLDRAFPLSLDYVPFSDVPLFAAAGFLAAMVLQESGRAERGAWIALAGGLGAATIAAHISHGFFGLPIRWEAAATDAVALAVGVWSARRWLSVLSGMLRGAARARAAIFAYAGLVVIWGWRPFLPELRVSAIAAQLTGERFVPLASLAERADVFSAVHVGQQFLLYFPAGALLAVWPLWTTGRRAHLWPAVWLALAVEFGHIVIVGRFFDLTNVLISCAGLGMGWIVVRRAGFTPFGEALPRRP